MSYIMDTETEKVVVAFRERLGIEAEYLIVRGILPLRTAKKFLVKEIYLDEARKCQCRQKGGKNFTEIKYELADAYGVSISVIDKMIYKKQ